jgi:cobalt-zinc-cadmium efflux system outer membrane protein
VQVARLKMVEAQRRARLERARVVKDVHLGADWERESGGGQLLGPKLGIELPVFDQNQAGIARAEHQARQWAKQVQALEGRLREEVGADLERVRFLRLKQDYLDNRMGPLRQEALAYARKWAGLMQLDQVSLLQAQRDLARTPLMSLRNRLELHQALAGLEYHLGGRLP